MKALASVALFQLFLHILERFFKKAIMLGEFLDVGMDVSRLVGLYSYGTFGRPGLSLSGQVCVMVAHMMAYLSG